MRGSLLKQLIAFAPRHDSVNAPSKWRPMPRILKARHRKSNRVRHPAAKDPHHPILEVTSGGGQGSKIGGS
ncbi:hypothetical protein CDAR_303781 [Caerostris darwini]|uniref:Uncharacterized protein n=1 Tax=Caerostris darwini TaxID=1538125 RepID=A0AAV4T575_9ARAC|nr:hypothetical protein CDAR_303781 [Caerostris darwini]